jgi:alginate O-acetyltransferase complex protein AlgI
MVFTSTVFIYAFMPIAFLCYFLVPARYRAFPLLFVSLFFYEWGEPRLVTLIIFSTILNYIFGRILFQAERFRKLDETRKIVS